MDSACLINKNKGGGGGGGGDSKSRLVAVVLDLVRVTHKLDWRQRVYVCVSKPSIANGLLVAEVPTLRFWNPLPVLLWES